MRRCGRFAKNQYKKFLVLVLVLALLSCYALFSAYVFASDNPIDISYKSSVVKAQLPMKVASAELFYYGGFGGLSTAAGMYGKGVMPHQLSGVAINGRFGRGWSQFFAKDRMSQKVFSYVLGAGTLFWYLKNRFFGSQAALFGSVPVVASNEYSQYISPIKHNDDAGAAKSVSLQPENLAASQKSPKNPMVPPLLDPVLSSDKSSKNTEEKVYSYTPTKEPTDWLQAFQNSGFDEQYYDKDQGSIHSEVRRLIAHYWRLENDEDIANTVNSKKRGASLLRPIKWDKSLLDHFVKTQINSYKELHLYLRFLFPNSLKFSSSQIARYYEESVDQIVARRGDLVSRMENFTSVAPKRIGPKAKRISSVTQFKQIIESMEISELYERIGAINIGNAASLSVKRISILQKRHIFVFFESLDKISKNIFIQYLLKLSDIVPGELSQEKMYAIEAVSYAFYMFVSGINTAAQKVSKANLQTDDHDYVKMFEELSAKRFKKVLSAFRLHTGKLLSQKDIYLVTKIDVEDFMNQHLQTRDLKDLFLALVLKIQDTTIDAYTTSHDVSRQYLVSQKIKISKDFDVFLAKRARKIDGSEVYLYLSELQDKYSSLSWRDLKSLFANMKTQDGVSFEDLKNFDSESFNLFAFRFLQSPRQEHIFYNSILLLDSAPVEHIAKIYHIDNSAVLKEKERMYAKLAQAFATKSFLKEDDEIIPFAKRVLSFTQLENLFQKFYNQSPYYLVNQLKLHLIKNYGFLETDLDISAKQIGEFVNNVLRLYFQRHIFFSSFLNLDESSLQIIGSSSGLSEANAAEMKSKILLSFKQFANIEKSKQSFENMFAERAKMSVLDLGLEKKISIYRSIDMQYVVSAMKDGLRALLNHHNRSQEFKANVHDVIARLNFENIEYFVEASLKKSDVLWNVYLIYFLGVENLLASDFAKHYKKKKEYVYRVKNRLVLHFISIVLGEGYEAYENQRPHFNYSASLQELWDVYNALEFGAIADRLKASLVKTYDVSEIPEITKKSIEFFVKSKVKGRLRQRLFLSALLRLDTFEEYSQVEEYKNYAFPQREVPNARLRLKSVLLNHLKQNRQTPAISKKPASQTILKNLKVAKKRYEKLDNEEILRRIRNSYLFEGVPVEAHDLLNADIVNKFIEGRLNTFDLERRSQFFWHVFFCSVLDLCVMDLQEFVDGYHLASKTAVQSARGKCRKFLLQILYNESDDFRKILKSHQSNLLKSIELGINKSLLLENSRFKNLYAWYSLGYLKTQTKLSLQALKYRFFNLHDYEIQKLFVQMIGDGFEDSLEMTHVDLFLHSALKSDLDWHVFFRMIFSYYNPSNEALLGSNDLNSLGNSLGNSLESANGIANMKADKRSVEEIEKSQERIRSKLEGVLELSKNKASLALIRLNGNREYSNKQRSKIRSLGELKGLYYAIGNVDIFEALNLYFRKTDGTVFEIMPESYERVLLEIHNVLRNHPLRWHIFLSKMLALDSSKSGDIRSVYGYSHNEYFSLKEKISDLINEVLMMHGES